MSPITGDLSRVYPCFSAEESWDRVQQSSVTLHWTIIIGGWVSLAKESRAHAIKMSTCPTSIINWAILVNYVNRPNFSGVTLDVTSWHKAWDWECSQITVSLNAGCVALN